MRFIKGFTLIELVLVIAILGVLAVAALPTLFNVSLNTARTNAMNATVGAVQTGISLHAAKELALGNPLTYPASLESTVVANGTQASNSSRLFTAVTQNGISAQWHKVTETGTTPNVVAVYAYDTDGDNAYNTSPGSDTCFTYTQSLGTFVQTGVSPCS
jgi:type IV pilus assembly protein PilE